MTEIPTATTQRAYTLRLRGVDPNDNSWRDALWATHEAVNKGVKVFGDWLLTLRGGLDHGLADAPVREKGGGTRAPTDDERRNRRILLALSWLSVEDADGAPRDESLIVAKWTDSSDCRARKLGDALAAILAKRGVADSELGELSKSPEDQPATWLGTCMSSISAAIKEKTVWVNRSAAFDSFTDRTGGHSDRNYAARTILGFLELKGPYFELPSLGADDSAATSGALEEKPLVNEATGWLCDNWGAGAKSDKSRISDLLTKLGVDLESFVGKLGVELVREFCRRVDVTSKSDSETDSLKALIGAVGWRGRKSAARMALESIAASKSLSAEAIEKLRDKFAKEAADKLAESTIAVPRWMKSERVEFERLIGMPYRSSKDHTFEYAVMLDHALRKLSSAHSWIKNAEAERRRFESDAKRVGAVPPNALEWLRRYCEGRTQASGSIEGYRIRRRAIDGWDKVVHAWAALGANSTRQQRIETARNVQANLDDSEKFGDIQLFAGLVTKTNESLRNA